MIFEITPVLPGPNFTVRMWVSGGEYSGRACGCLAELGVRPTGAVASSLGFGSWLGHGEMMVGLREPQLPLVKWVRVFPMHRTYEDQRHPVPKEAWHHTHAWLD